MARAPRVQQSQPLYDDDSDGGAEPETPKPKRSGIRKRLSEAHQDPDASFVSDSGAQNSVEINDDAAEKRRRRKSTRMTVAFDDSQAGSSSQQADGQTQARAAKHKLDLPQIPQTTINKSDHATYEKWMKVATENKISQQNTWDVLLIDYFHDLSLLRNVTDNSINFQRASCTLDGCIKIWTSRVDSVGTETAKLASNLASGGIGADDDDLDNGSDDDGDRPEKKRKKSHRNVATLVKDPEQLRVKKLDLEFSVDPLFRKTSADFDEGGAQGLLMNHLSIGVGEDGNLRVVFDASDAVSKTDEEELEDEKEDLIDFSHLRTLIDLSVLDSKEISHSLADFSFAANDGHDEATFFQDNTHHADDDDDDFGGGGGIDPSEPVEDFFSGDNAIQDDYPTGMMGGDDFGSDPNGSVEPGEGGNETGTFGPFDPSQAPERSNMAFAMADESGGVLDYFDRSLTKNWAGPEHWRVHRTIRRENANADANAAKEPKRREKKEANKIDFLTPRTKAEIDKLFEKPAKPASINLPKTKKKEKRNDHKLPDDMHFTSQQLVTLFLKPKFALHMRGRSANTTLQANGEVDPNYWAQAPADQAAAGNEADNTELRPFNTQFFQEDYDDLPGFDDIYDGDGGGPMDPIEQDLLAETQGMPRRAKPAAVKYAKRAKRVDVKKLKDNIWNGLEIVVPKKKQNEDEMDVDVDEVEATSPTEGRQFNGVISNLQTQYSADKLQDISTSFCFICLLHLANEQGLKLENTSTLNKGESDSEARKVGNIWDLKVYRDPTAAAG